MTEALASKPGNPKADPTPAFAIMSGNNMPVATGGCAFTNGSFGENVGIPVLKPEDAKFDPTMKNTLPWGSNGSHSTTNWASSEASTELDASNNSALFGGHRHFTSGGTTYYGSNPGNVYNSPPGDFHGHSRQTSYNSLPGNLQVPPTGAGAGPGLDNLSIHFGSPYLMPVNTHYDSPEAYTRPSNHTSPLGMPSQIASPASFGAASLSPYQGAGNAPFHADAPHHFTAPVPFGGQGVDGQGVGETYGHINDHQFFTYGNAMYYGSPPGFGTHPDAGRFAVPSNAANAAGANNGFSGPCVSLNFDSATIEAFAAIKAPAWLCTCSCGCRMPPEDDGESLCWWCDFNPGHDGYGKGPMLFPRPQ